MRERVHQFGTNRDLCGVTSEPAARLDTSDLPALIFLNSGIMHHVGPNRLQVHLARILADDGYVAFRFDLSGIGDSESRKDFDAIEERSVREIREAMDYLQSSFGIDRFVLVGLCTGADNGHRAAVSDERVCGAILIDGYVYITLKHLMHRFRSKIFRVSTWINILRRLFSSSKSKLETTNEFEGINYYWVPPAKHLVEQQFKMLVSRQVHLLQIFSGSYPPYNYREQFHDAFRTVDFESFLEVEYFENADHTFSLSRDRDMLTNLVIKWISNRFSAL